MNTQWSGEEDLALDYLPWQAQVLYLRGLRRRMDYRTGIVGATSQSDLSRSWLLSLLEVHPERGSKAERQRITVSALRNLLSRLERAGLIKPIKNNDRRMIFFLPLAVSDKSVQMRNGRGTAEERPTSNDRAKPSNGAACSDMNNRGKNHAAPAMNGRIPETDKQQDKNNTVAVATDASPTTRVFNYWRDTMSTPRSQLDNKRKTAIASRLRDGYSVEQICQGIDGCAASAWHMGDNDRKRKFNDIELICRTAAKLDNFIDMRSTRKSDEQALAEFIGDNTTDVIEGEFFHE